MRRYNKYYYKACESYMYLKTEEIILKQVRCENMILVNELLVKIGFIFFFGALFWAVRLAFANVLYLTSWSLYVIVFYIGLFLICSGILKRLRAYSDAAEVMLQFENEEARQTYFDEKLKPQFD